MFHTEARDAVGCTSPGLTVPLASGLRQGANRRLTGVVGREFRSNWNDRPVWQASSSPSYPSSVNSQRSSLTDGCIAILTALGCYPGIHLFVGGQLGNLNGIGRMTHDCDRLARGRDESTVTRSRPGDYHPRFPEHTIRPTDIYPLCRNCGAGQTPSDAPFAGRYDHSGGIRRTELNGNLSPRAWVFGGGTCQGRITEIANGTGRGWDTGAGV